MSKTPRNLDSSSNLDRLYQSPFLLFTLVVLLSMAAILQDVRTVSAQDLCAGFCLVDNFDTRANGSIRGQGNWQTNPPGALDGAIVTDTPPAEFTGKALLSDPNGVIFRGNAYKPLGINAIDQGQNGTLFFQIYTQDLPNTFTHIGLTDLGSPRLTDGGTGDLTLYTDFEVQFSWANGKMRIQDGQSSVDFTNISPESQTLYNVWLVVNNQADTYEAYVQGGVHAVPVQAEANGQRVFSFRNGRASADLRTFLYLNSPDVQTSKAYIDSIYIDPDAKNLVNPIPQFSIIETFDSISLGNLNNRNGWSTSTTDVGDIQIVGDPVNIGNRILKISSAEADASKRHAGIENGATGTLFFRMRRDGFVDSSVGLSSAAAPADYPDFENQVNVQNTSTLNVRNGAGFSAVDTFLENTWYCVWIVTDNATDTYETYMKGGNLPTVTRLDSGGLTSFAYRNGTNNALSTFFTRHTDSSGEFYIDDIYVDADQKNLATPTANGCEMTNESADPLIDPIPDSITKSGLGVRLVEFATIPASSSGVPSARINFLDHANDGSGRLFVNDLRNSLYLIQNGNVTTYLNLSARFPDFVSEQRLGTGFGFFSFHPEFASNGKFYTVHTENGNALSSRSADYTSTQPETVHSIIVEWTATTPSANVFSGTQREILRIGFGSYLHGIQQIGFHPTARPGTSDYGLLYVAVGDGDENPIFTDAPQNLSLPHGKILRIDPLGTGSPNGQYGIPSSNPFVSANSALDEIWAYGLRNPHRFSWDVSGTNKMFIGHIGEKNIDAIYPGLAGANYGWNEREGGFLFKTENPNVVYPLPANDASFGYTYPVAQYDHDEGFAVVGGFVYRGAGIPQLRGKYVFGDLVNGRFFYTNENDMAAGEPMVTIRELTLFDAAGREKTMQDFVGISRADIRFGVDAQNELYVLSKSNAKIWRLTSVAPQLGDVTCNGSVNAADALFILQFVAGLRTDAGGCPMADSATELNIGLADVNNSGDVSAVDALLVLQCDVGIANVLCEDGFAVQTAGVKNAQSNQVFIPLMSGSTE